MIDMLHTLQAKLKSREVFIWNVNRDSMAVFLRAAFMGVNIQGFVSDEYVGERYMNRPIVALREIQCNDNSIVLVADEVPEYKFNILPVGQRVYWKDALEINEELRYKKIIVYGIGKGEERIYKLLNEEGIEAELFCVSKISNSRLHRGKNVIEAAELNEYKEYVIIISVLEPQYREEILDELICYSGRIYIELDDIMDRPEDLINFVQSLNEAIVKGKDVYLYSKKNLIAELIDKTLSNYGIQTKGYVYDIEDEKQDIKSVYEIDCWEGKTDKLIIINEQIPARLVEAREKIELMNFSLDNGDYISLKDYTYAEQWMLSELREYADPLCGHSILYPHGEPGWKLYGKNDEDSIKILVVGGSTSSEIYHPENWISKLYHKLYDSNIKVAIYNGAHVCNDIVSEILRILRDGYALKPHIIVSMSGVNNTYYKKCVNQFNEERLIWRVAQREYYSGVSNDESLFFFWKRNVELLKLISEFYGASYFCFLQPMNITMTSMDLQEKSLYEREQRIEGARSFSKFADEENDNLYINLMRLFEHQDGMYFDIAHYTDKGHTIIADKVYKAICPLIMKLREKGGNGKISSMYL